MTDYNNPPKFCWSCGSEVKETKIKIEGYYQETGRPIYSIFLECPNNRNLFSGFHENDWYSKKWRE